MDPAHEFVVLVSHWDNGWDVFILDAEQGLVTTTRSVTLADVRWAAERALSQHFDVSIRGFNLRLILP
jgi:hypothetical protein